MLLIRFRNEFSQWLGSTLGIEVFPRQIYQFSQIPAKSFRATSRSSASELLLSARWLP
jgi:hypothetical protein